jgi:outer membrane protein TolC
MSRVLSRAKYATTFVSIVALICLAAFANQANAFVEEKAVPDISDENAPDQMGDGEKIKISKPELKALVSITANMDPYTLDARGVQPISLTDALNIAVAHNLDIGLSQLSESIGKTNYVGALTKFLPDLNLGYNYYYLTGDLNLPMPGSTGGNKINGPFIMANAGFKYYAYRGGATVFGALKNKNLWQAAKYQKHATISDALLETTKRYYDLLLAEGLLQIRIRAVAVSQAQVELSQSLVEAGRATQLDLYQSQTQLSQDKQKLINQQIARRTAAIALADYLNIDQAVDLAPIDSVVHKIRLVDANLSANDIVATAFNERPEIKQKEQERVAAKQAARVARAPLLPTFAFGGNVYGLGQTLSNSSTTTLTPITIDTAAGATTVDTLTRQSRQIQPLYSLSYSLNWNLSGLGATDLANIHAAQLAARQALLQQNRQVNTVQSEVRQSYLNALSAERQLDEATAQVKSASEELRLSRLRFANGLSKNLDVLRAQQDYTQSLIEKMQAIVTFNVTQAQLLRDMGVVTIASLTAPNESLAARSTIIK